MNACLVPSSLSQAEVESLEHFLFHKACDYSFFIIFLIFPSLFYFFLLYLQTKRCYMRDKKKITQYNVEMVEQANGAAQYLGVLIADSFMTRNQVRHIADFVLAQTKRNIESVPLFAVKTKRTRRYIIESA